MSIRVVCSCGEAIHADDAFAGGYVKCPQCAQQVPVPEPEPKRDDKVHFTCPHCSVRVVGKLSSVGKRSNCPSCGEEYVIPPPSAEPEPQQAETSLHPRKRFQLDESALEDLPSQRRFPVEPHAPSTAGLAPASGITDEMPVKIPAEASNGASIADEALPTELSVPPPTELSIAAPTELSIPQPTWLAAPVAQPREVPSAPSSPQEPMASPRDEGPSIHVSLKILDDSHSARQSDSAKTIFVDAKYFLIGRGRDCHFRPKNSSVSQHHCVLKLDRHAARIRDMGSRKGTFVNGHRIYGEVILHHSDMVRLGDYRFQVAIAEEEALVERAAAMQPSLDDFHVAY